MSQGADPSAAPDPVPIGSTKFSAVSPPPKHPMNAS